MSDIFKRDSGATGVTIQIASSPASQDVELTGEGNAVRIVLNTSFGWAKTGSSSQTATNTDIPLFAGVNILRLPEAHTHIAFLTFDAYTRISVIRGHVS